MGWDSAPGTEIGRYVVHWADGQQELIPIVAGKNTWSWWRRPSVEPQLSNRTVVAWTGSNPFAASNGATIQLFKFRWENPRPEVLIERIDFISAMAEAAPFLIAITAE
jgi:hypothetical protein